MFTLQDARTPRSNQREELVIGKDATILHADLNLQFMGKGVYLDPVGAEDPGHDGEMVVRPSGIVPNPIAVRRSSSLRNGFATILKSGIRIIVYDPVWFGTLTSLAARYMVLGH